MIEGTLSKATPKEHITLYVLLSDGTLFESSFTQLERNFSWYPYVKVKRYPIGVYPIIMTLSMTVKKVSPV
jgi:hypothetical protein